MKYCHEPVNAVEEHCCDSFTVCINPKENEVLPPVDLSTCPSKISVMQNYIRN